MKEGWKNMKLGEISVSIKDGDWIEKKDQSLYGFRLIQTGNIGVGLFKNKAESARYISEETFSRLHCEEVFEGNILISRLPDPVGRACIVPHLDTRNITAVDCSIVKLNSKIINSDYFILYTQSNKYFNKVSSLSTGTTRQRITRKKLAELQIPVPPLPEQQRIVSYLDAQFAKIDQLKENAERQLQAAKDLFQSSLKELLTPKEGWVEKKLGDYATLITKGASPKWQGFQYQDSGIPFITSENVRDGFIDISPRKFLLSDFNVKQKRSILHKNDVLVNIVGASIGRAAIFDLDYLDANINQAVALVRCDSTINVRFLCMFLNSEMASKQYDFYKKDSARANLSLENISSLSIHCPSLSEQQQIANKLDTISAKVKALQTNYTETITLCNDLKQSLLKQIFE